MAQLVFDRPLAGPPHDLVFGADAPTGGDATVALAITVPAPGISATLQEAQLQALSLAVTVPAPSVACATMYDNAVFRGVPGSARAGWSDGADLANGARAAHQVAEPRPAVAATRWSAARLASAGPSIAGQDGLRLARGRRTRWQDAGRRHGAPLGIPFRDLGRHPRRTASGWREGRHARADAATGYQDRLRRPRPSIAAAWQQGRPAALSWTVSAQQAAALLRYLAARHQDAIKPPPGLWIVPPPPVIPPDPCYTPPPAGVVSLLFADGLPGSAAKLIFICRNAERPGFAIVPARRVYIVVNDVRLIRVDGNIDLPVLGLTLSLDADSWAYGFSASLPASALSQIEPAALGDPVELEAQINGQAFRLLAENIARDREFPRARVSLSGRGISAHLGEPYSPTISYLQSAQLTAQQLMADVLTVNGQSIGWTIDWQITDWLVPAGVFAAQGSYIEAANRIAAAAGAYIQPHATAQSLRVLARYPVAPWDWTSAAPDLELPSDAVQRESIQWQERPAINSVHVSGTSAGVLAQVRRLGTAGDIAAPMIVDALITAADAARQRGAVELYRAGRSALVSLSLPVLPQSGIIHPGQLVRYVDNGVPRYGLTRGVSVNAGRPGLRQTVEIEAHA